MCQFSSFSVSFSFSSNLLQPSFENRNYSMAPIIPIKTVQPGDTSSSTANTLPPYQNFAPGSMATIEGFIISPSHAASMASLGMCSLDGQLHTTGQGQVVFAPVKPQQQLPRGRSQSATDVSAYSTKWLVSPALSTDPALLTPPPNSAAPAVPGSAVVQPQGMPFQYPGGPPPQVSGHSYHNSHMDMMKMQQEMHNASPNHQPLSPSFSQSNVAGDEKKMSIDRRPSGSSRKLVRSSPDGHPSHSLAQEIEMGERATSGELQGQKHAFGLPHGFTESQA